MDRIDNLVISESDLGLKTRIYRSNPTYSLIEINENDKAAIDKLNEELKKLIADKYDHELKSREIKQGDELEKKIEESVIDYLSDEKYLFKPLKLKSEIIRSFMLSLSGYGILQPLMDDDAVEDIYIYAPDKIYVLKNGEKIKSDIKFESSEKLKAYISNILSRSSRAVNNKNPIEDGRMADGSRIAVSGEVLSPNGITMNIRRFPKERMTLDKLVSSGSMDSWCEKILINTIKTRMNFIVSGGTSSGKTTMLNAMAQYIDPTDNVCTIEDNIELQLNRDFWLQLETRKENIEGNGEITMEDLLVHILRRSPDRIIVGEIRSGEVADTFLNAIQTGHDGTCATIHANNAERCRSRMCKLASIASDEPFEAALDDFNHSIQIIIQLKRDNYLKRRVLSSIDFVKDDGTLVNLCSFDRATGKFIHHKLPEEMLEIYKEYGIEEIKDE